MDKLTLAMIDETQVIDAIELLKKRKELWLDKCIYCRKKIKNADDFHSFIPIDNKVYILCSIVCFANWTHKIMVWNECGNPQITKKSLQKFRLYIKKFKKSTQAKS